VSFLAVSDAVGSFLGFDEHVVPVSLFLFH
jgi:hypothetical protein